MIFPTRQDIVRLNRRHILRSEGLLAGTDNLTNPGSLDWVLDAIQHPVFGVEPYPTIQDKAAMLAWEIIAAHVFADGNKRTGMSALKAFLRANGYMLEALQDEVIETALKIADAGRSGYTRDEFIEWVRGRTRSTVPRQS